MQIDIEKFIGSLIISDKNMYSKKTRCEWIEDALKEQGLKFRNGKLVSIRDAENT